MTLITAATAQWHDYELLESRLPSDGGLAADRRDGGLLHADRFSGPTETREILAGLCEADLSRPWLTHQTSHDRRQGREPHRASALPASSAGKCTRRWATCRRFMPPSTTAGEPLGLKPFGMFALDSLRIEKGYRTWKGDLSTDYTLLQAGLDRFIHWDKPDFVGKQALLAERERGPSKRFVTLVVEAGDCDAPYMSTLWQGENGRR